MDAAVNSAVCTWAACGGNCGGWWREEPAVVVKARAIAWDGRARWWGGERALGTLMWGGRVCSVLRCAAVGILVFSGPVMVLKRRGALLPHWSAVVHAPGGPLREQMRAMRVLETRMQTRVAPQFSIEASWNCTRVTGLCVGGSLGGSVCGGDRPRSWCQNDDLSQRMEFLKLNFWPVLVRWVALCLFGC